MPTKVSGFKKAKSTLDELKASLPKSQPTSVTAPPATSAPDVSKVSSTISKINDYITKGPLKSKVKEALSYTARKIGTGTKEAVLNKSNFRPYLSAKNIETGVKTGSKSALPLATALGAGEIVYAGHKAKESMKQMGDYTRNIEKETGSIPAIDAIRGAKLGFENALANKNAAPDQATKDAWDQEAGRYARLFRGLSKVNKASSSVEFKPSDFLGAAGKSLKSGEAFQGAMPGVKTMGKVLENVVGKPSEKAGKATRKGVDYAIKSYKEAFKE